MPNHLHTIVRLKKPEMHGAHVKTHGAQRRDARPCVSTTATATIIITTITTTVRPETKINIVVYRWIQIGNKFQNRRLY
jgi:hypothetical protein